MAGGGSRRGSGGSCVGEAGSTGRAAFASLPARRGRGTGVGTCAGAARNAAASRQPASGRRAGAATAGSAGLPPPGTATAGSSPGLPPPGAATAGRAGLPPPGAATAGSSPGFPPLGAATAASSAGLPPPGPSMDDEEGVAMEEEEGVTMEKKARPKFYIWMELVVGVRPFFLVDGGTKSWQQGKVLSKQIVDIHNFGLAQLVDFIAEHYMWGSKQMISLFRELDNDCIEIKSDEQLHEWFELNAEKGVVHITAQINDFEGPLQCSPTKRRCHPSVRSRATKEAAKYVRAKSKSEKKGDIDDCVPSDSSYDTDLAASSESDPEYECDPDVEIFDDDDDDEFDPPPFSYDEDNPCIDVGVIFPDTRQCKDFQIVDMHDKIRQMIIERFVVRAKIASKMLGIIIPSITNALNAKSKTIKDHDVLICGAGKAEVTVNRFRYAVHLEQQACTCRAWQVTGKPCNHALAFIAKLSRKVPMDTFVHEYFSIDRLKKAYEGTFNPMASKDSWTKVDLGYKLKKPKLRRKPGRPRHGRVKAHDEVGTKKQRLCSECNELGHTAKHCQGGPTASQKKQRALIASASVGADASARASTRGRGRGRGRATGTDETETGRGRGMGRGRRGRGGGRGRYGGLATWFGFDA